MRRLIVILLAAMLAGCGFQLRGSYTLPWETLYIGLPEFDALRAEIKRNVEAASNTKVVDDPKQAKAKLVITSNQQQRSILSLSGRGYVREIQLTRVFSYRIQNADGKDIAPPGQILLQRDMTYDDELLLAKESEERVLQRDMQSDLVQQLLRRLSLAKPLADDKKE